MAGRVRVALGFGLAVAGTLSLMAACSPAPVRVAARVLSPIAVGEIRRIAVLPFSVAELSTERSTEPGAEPLSEPPEATVTRAVLAAMRTHGDWQVVDELLVDEAMRRLYGKVLAPSPDEALAVGRLLRSDAVLRGEVRVFAERIGTQLAAKQPAHVVFTVELLRIADGASVWQAEYAEQQQSLSENLWNLSGFIKAGGVWVRAGELARFGAAQVVTQMHTTLYGPASKKRPATSTR